MSNYKSTEDGVIMSTILNTVPTAVFDCYYVTDRQTDRQTDGRTPEDSKDRASMRRAGKNYWQ